MPTHLSGTVAEFAVPVFFPGDSYQHHTDAELIERCLQRDEQAWQSLLNRYGSFVYSIITRFNLMADEMAYVFQAVFLSALDNLQELVHEPNLSTWFTTITLWYCRQYAEPDQADEILAMDETSALYQEIEQLEEQRSMQQALASMQEPARRALFELLNWLDDISVTQASSLGNEDPAMLMAKKENIIKEQLHEL
ncbi:MAG: sigma-70 family RNA polymerase sigma factor [Acidobacteriota bacterium]|nr:hypothetical protein [Blastocatellia bacterium]MDW8238541.1 sigma-70 family RNA polymerase sigma factor [Acidobacteriota bacterium]